MKKNDIKKTHQELRIYLREIELKSKHKGKQIIAYFKKNGEPAHVITDNYSEAIQEIYKQEGTIISLCRTLENTSN